MVKSLIIVLLCTGLMPCAVYSQNMLTDNIKWSSEEFLEENSNAYIPHESYFISYGNDSVQWVQGAGAHVYTFIVTGENGAWGDLETNGSLTYQVVLDNQTGSLTFSRDGDWVTVRMQLPGIIPALSPKLFNHYIV